MSALEWIVVVLSLLGTLGSTALLLTLMRGVFRLMDNVDELEGRIELLEQRKMDRPVPPPDIVPLERM